MIKSYTCVDNRNEHILASIAELPHKMCVYHCHILCNLATAATLSRNYYNDGSKDRTWELIEEEHRDHPIQVRGVKLAGNVGHQFALTAGLIRTELPKQVRSST